MRIPQLLAIISLAASAFAAEPPAGSEGKCSMYNGFDPGSCTLGNGVVVRCNKTYYCINDRDRCQTYIDPSTGKAGAYCSSIPHD